MKDSELIKIAHSIVHLSPIIDWERGKVGAIKRISVDKDKLKMLKPRHFNHPRP